MTAEMICRRRGSAVRVGGCLLAAWLLCGAPAGAQDDAARAAARDLAREGVSLLKAEQYAEAQQKLRRAYALYPMPTVALFEGEALEKLGRWVEASERYQVAKLAELPEGAHSALRSAIARAGREYDRLTPLIPKLVIELQGAEPARPGLEIQIDGKPLKAAMIGLPRPADPGEHEVVALYHGEEQRRETVKLEPSQSETVVLTLSLPEAPVAADPSADAEAGATTAGSGDDVTADRAAAGATQRTLGWVSLGVGSAGLITGVVAGAVMMGKDSTLEENCPGGTCPPEYQSDLDAFTTWRTVSFVGYGVGIVGLGAGVVLLLTAPSDAEQDSSAGISPWIGPGQVGVTGTF